MCMKPKFLSCASCGRQLASYWWWWSALWAWLPHLENVRMHFELNSNWKLIIKLRRIWFSFRRKDEIISDWKLSHTSFEKIHFLESKNFQSEFSTYPKWYVNSNRQSKYCWHLSLSTTYYLCRFIGIFNLREVHSQRYTLKPTKLYVRHPH